MSKYLHYQSKLREPFDIDIIVLAWLIFDDSGGPSTLISSSLIINVQGSTKDIWRLLVLLEDVSLT